MAGRIRIQNWDLNEDPPERPSYEGNQEVMFLGGIQNAHPITLSRMVHTSGRADEIDLFKDLLERCNTPNTEDNRSVMVNAFKQGLIDGTIHQR